MRRLMCCVILLCLAQPLALGQGQVYGFGNNSFGQLGIAGGGNISVPQTLSIPGTTAVSASSGHGLALKNDGTVWAWGLNRYGELGNTTNNNNSGPNPTPVQVGGLTS